MTTSIIVAAIAFVGGVVTWRLNERSKRLLDERKWKEERYAELIRALKGFYLYSSDTKLRETFLTQLNLCWMYCPDEVIRAAYDFLSTVSTEGTHTDEEKEGAAGRLMVAIREDLVSRKRLKKTELRPNDFRHLKATVIDAKHKVAGGQAAATRQAEDDSGESL